MDDLSPVIFWNIILTLVYAPLIYGIRQNASELKRIDILVNKTREEMAKHYVTKDDLAEDLERIVSEICEPKYRTGFDRNFWLWEQYDPQATYLMVADVARGDGADSSVFHIIRLDTMTVVAEYQGKPSLDLYSQILFDAGKEYNDCLLVVENNGI